MKRPQGARFAGGLDAGFGVAESPAEWWQLHAQIDYPDVYRRTPGGLRVRFRGVHQPAADSTPLLRWVLSRTCSALVRSPETKNFSTSYAALINRTSAGTSSSDAGAISCVSPTKTPDAWVQDGKAFRPGGSREPSVISHEGFGVVADRQGRGQMNGVQRAELQIPE